MPRGFLSLFLQEVFIAGSVFRGHFRRGYHNCATDCYVFPSFASLLKAS